MHRFYFMITLCFLIALFVSFSVKSIYDLKERVEELETRLTFGSLDPNYELIRSIGILHSNISEENYEIVDEALQRFDLKMRRYLALIPFVAGDARTALARTQTYEPPLNVYTIVSSDWDLTHFQSRYWETSYKPRGENPDEPVFPRSYKLNLFIHEYLHHAELKRDVAIEKFFYEVQRWYNDPAWGEASPQGNYQKFTLYWHIYREGSQYSQSPNLIHGREEFAYIGEMIASGNKKYLNELPPSIISYYTGVLRKDLLR